MWPLKGAGDLRCLRYQEAGTASHGWEVQTHVPTHVQLAAGQIQEAGTEAVFVRGNPELIWGEGGEERHPTSCLNFKFHVCTSWIYQILTFPKLEEPGML